MCAESPRFPSIDVDLVGACAHFDSKGIGLMPDQGYERFNAPISRRTIARGAAWAAPAVVAASALPAFAVSPCKGCYSYNWSSADLGKLASEVVMVGQLDTGVACATPPTASISLDMGGTPGASTSCSTDPPGLYSKAFNGRIGYQGEQNGYPASKPYTIPPLSATNPGLILNIGHETATSVTWTFSQPVDSVAVDIYDISRGTRTDYSSTWRYTDTVAFNQPVKATGDTTYANRTTMAAGETFYRTRSYTSGTTMLTTFTTTNTSPISSLTLTYSAPEYQGWQFIAVGKIRTCAY